jgi:hypothetical protein
MTLPLVAFVLAASPAPDSTVKVAVMDFQPAGASVELTQAVEGVVAHELEQLGVFKVTTGDAVKALIALERQRQILGCDEPKCSTPSLTQIDADYLVGGRVTSVAGAGTQTFTLELTLLNVSKGQREASDVQRAPNGAELLNAATHAAVRLVQTLLAARSGGLIVTVSEAGATVKVDDWVVGATPLTGQLTLPGGPHALRVEKDGFVTFRKDVRVEPDHVAEEHAILVPSPDFIEEHRAHAGKLRLGAYLVTGLAVAALVTGAALELSADQTYGSTTTPNTFLYDRTQLQNGDESYRLAATALQTRIGNKQTFSAVSFIVGGVAAAGAGFLWVAGDDPGKYDKFRPLKMGVAVSPAGASVGLGGSF